MGRKNMMSTSTVGNLTISELRKLIAEVVDQQLTRTLGVFDLSDEQFPDDNPADTRSVEEVLASIDQHMWTPPPGARSSQELLREVSRSENRIPRTGVLEPQTSGAFTDLESLYSKYARHGHSSSTRKP